jgi:hypothetical protein
LAGGGVEQEQLARAVHRPSTQLANSGAKRPATAGTVRPRLATGIGADGRASGPGSAGSGGGSSGPAPRSTAASASSPARRRRARAAR